MKTVMTNEQINERIAKLCGWKVSSNNEVWRSPDSKTIQNGPPSYHSSLDACREFESKLTGDDRSLYMDILYLFISDPGEDFTDSDFDNKWAMFNSTPIQRCEAFLLMKGQWD